MKKWLVVTGLLMVPALFMSKAALADGNYLPVLVVSSTTNQGYLYPNSASSSTPGGTLVNNGGGAFNWSNATVVSTTSQTSSQFPGLPNVTAAQVAALAAVAVGQEVFCTNCQSANLGAGDVCVSTSTNTGGFVIQGSSLTAVTVCK